MIRTIIVRDSTLKARAHEALDAQEMPYRVRIDEADDKRTLDQNALLWPLLTCLSKQVNWYGNWLDEWAWKDMMTATLKGQKAVPNLDGTGFIILGHRTSKMGKKEFSELIEFIYAFGSEKGVAFDRHNSPLESHSPQP